jgi:cell division protein FtsL
MKRTTATTGRTQRLMGYLGGWTRAIADTLSARRHVGPFMAVVVSAAVLFVGLYYVWTRMQMVQTGFEISNLEKKNRELKKRTRELLLEIASLQSPDELEKKASKIGLRLPEMGKVVHVP